MGYLCFNDIPDLTSTQFCRDLRMGQYHCTCSDSRALESNLLFSWELKGTIMLGQALPLTLYPPGGNCHKESLSPEVSQFFFPRYKYILRSPYPSFLGPWGEGVNFKCHLLISSFTTAVLASLISSPTLSAFVLLLTTYFLIVRTKIPTRNKKEN